MITLFLSTPTIQSAISERGETLDTLREAMGASKFPFVRMKQTHSNHFKKIERSKEFEQEIPDTDACYTLKKNILLTVKTADCLPILFYHHQCHK